MTTNKPIWQTSLKVISSITQFILGFVLGVSLITGAAIAAGYLYLTTMSYISPKKPIYEEEKASKTVTKSEIATETTEKSPTVPEDLPIFPGEAETEPEPEAEEIPENAYFARVTWPQGLSLRAEPSINSERVGGIGYDAKILILEQSSDKQWQRIRIPSNKQEGWVKAGNIKRVSE